MIAVDFGPQDDASERFAAIIEGMNRLFGDAALGIAERQYEAADGEARTVWQRIVIALSDR